MSNRTWNEDEIRKAVLTYSEGCTDGKIRFLDDAFGIDGNCEQEVTLTVTLKISTYDESGEEIDASDVSAAVESLLDDELGGRMAAETVDARSRVQG